MYFRAHRELSLLAKALPVISLALSSCTQVPNKSFVDTRLNGFMPSATVPSKIPAAQGSSVANTAVLTPAAPLDSQYVTLTARKSNGEQEVWKISGCSEAGIKSIHRDVFGQLRNDEIVDGLFMGRPSSNSDRIAASFDPVMRGKQPAATAEGTYFQNGQDWHMTVTVENTQPAGKPTYQKVMEDGQAFPASDLVMNRINSAQQHNVYNMTVVFIPCPLEPEGTGYIIEKFQHVSGPFTYLEFELAKISRPQ